MLKKTALKGFGWAVAYMVLGVLYFWALEHNAWIGSGPLILLYFVFIPAAVVMPFAAYGGMFGFMIGVGLGVSVYGLLLTAIFRVTKSRNARMGERKGRAEDVTPFLDKPPK